MPRLALLDRRLIVVTGKGGVGKSTVSAALAILAARRGKRVLVCEVNGPERIAPMLGAPPSGYAGRELLPSLHTMSVTPQEAMREYGLMVLRFQSIYDAVFENRVVRFFLRAIPSLAELVLLGKIMHESRVEERGRRRWDLVVVDGPSTGHAVQLLRVPAALLDTVPGGPLRRDAQWMHALLQDPAFTSVALVTLPEDMPVNEAVELDAAVRDVLGMPRGALVVNAMPEARFTAPERARLAELSAAGPPLGPAAQAGWLQALRSEAAARQLARARAAIDLPTLLVPLFPRERWDGEALDLVATALGPEL